MPNRVRGRLGPVGLTGLQDLKEQKVGAWLPCENAHGCGLYSVGARAQDLWPGVSLCHSPTPSSASSSLCKGLESRLNEKVSTESPSNHLVHRWSSENANGWFCRTGVRFKDGLRAPGRLLCTFLGDNFLRVSIFISLRKISDSKGPGPLGLGLGQWVPLSTSMFCP